MALFPLTGYVQGDFVPHLVAVDTDDPVPTVVEKIAVHSVGRRLPVQPDGYDLVVDDEVAPHEATLGSLGLVPMQFVEVRPRG